MAEQDFNSQVIEEFRSPVTGFVLRLMLWGTIATGAEVIVLLSGADDAAARRAAEAVLRDLEATMGGFVFVIGRSRPVSDPLELARAAINAGADAVMCCHHHSLRGVELVGGKPIFYGLGALIHHFNSIRTTSADKAARYARFGERSSFKEDEDFPLFPFRVDARKTGIAVLGLGADGSIETGFVPAQMLADGSTEPLRVEDPRAGEVCDYLERLTLQSGFATRFGRGALGEWMYLRIEAAG